MLERIAVTSLAGAERGNANEATTAAYHALHGFFRWSRTYGFAYNLFLAEHGKSESEGDDGRT
jgi:hypothetical protein